MSVYKLSNAGGLTTKPRYTSFLAGNAATVIQSSMFTLGVVTLTSTQTSIVFNNIPQSYVNLEIRGIARTTQAAAGGSPITMNFNNDSGANYSIHQLYGSGSGVGDSIGNANQTRALWAASGGWQSLGSGDPANFFSTHIISINNYSSGSTYKTVRARHGRDTNQTTGATGRIMYESSNWRSFSPITSITIACDTQFVAGTSFSLYGIKDSI